MNISYFCSELLSLGGHFFQMYESNSLSYINELSAHFQLYFVFELDQQYTCFDEYISINMRDT